MVDLCEFELNTLRDIASGTATWGAAVSAAIGVLKLHGFIILSPTGQYVVTRLGHQVLKGQGGR